jgi:hypothetical protein
MESRRPIIIPSILAQAGVQDLELQHIFHRNSSMLLATPIP